ncbi:MAG: hypothetical protein KDD69_00895 [Bdellovibrionales bacterium]|nr:hypothetical protein [Bdellovibrionales bacterium]
MNAKKVVNFLICRSAFSQRNMTSMLLVFVFIGVYAAAGGKITTTLPKMEGAGLLGGARTAKGVDVPGAMEESTSPDLTKRESKSVLGIVPTDDQQARREEINQRGRLFTPDEVDEAQDEPIDREGLVQGKDFTSRRDQWKLEQAEKRPTDSLEAIEERLQIRRRR